MERSGTDKLLRVIFLVLPLAGLASLMASIVAAIYMGHFTAWTSAGIIAGLALFATLFIKAEMANLLYYLNVFVYSAFVLGICVVGYMFARAYEPQLDLTQQRLYSLSGESARFLKTLDQRGIDVRVIFFYNTRDPFRSLEQLYGAETGRVGFEYIDPVRDPVAAREIAMDLDVGNVNMGEMFVVSGNKNRRLSIAELMQGNFENVLTNAILEVTLEGETKIYFTTGHGELRLQPRRAVGGAQPDPSAQILAQILGERGIATATLDLVATGAVPDDASAVVIAGPDADFHRMELDALGAYLDRGGRLLVTLGLPLTNLDQPPMDGLRGLLADYGVEVGGNELVIDWYSQQIGLRRFQPLVAYMAPQHPITKNLAAMGQRPTLALVRPVGMGPVPDNRYESVELLRSSEASNVAPLEQVLAGRDTPPSRDFMTQVPMAAAVSMSDPPRLPGHDPIPRPEGTYRLAVFGAGDLLEDQTIANQPILRMLMLNTINWLAQREEAIDVPPRELPGTPLILEPAQMRVLFVFAIVLLPGGVFFGGISYSILRRRK